MNPGGERGITTTPAESRQDRPNRAPSGTRNTVDTGTDGAAGDAASDKNGTGEVGGRDGPNPARYGDWEKNGRCIDF